jgi:SNF family Na+-dependent transporter
LKKHWKILDKWVVEVVYLLHQWEQEKILKRATAATGGKLIPLTPWWLFYLAEVCERLVSAIGHSTATLSLGMGIGSGRCSYLERKSFFREGAFFFFFDSFFRLVS